jgi:hypothetical protein
VPLSYLGGCYRSCLSTHPERKSTMFDVFHVASTIANDWPAVVGGKLPKELDAAIEAFAAARFVEEPYA